MSMSPIDRAAQSPAEKRALLAELLRKKVAESRSEFPLSYGQRALLYLSRLQPDAPTYNAMFTIRLSARIDVDVLRSAFQRIIDRHAVLRTTYTVNSEKAVQQVHAASEADFVAYDISTWDERQEEAHLLAEAARPFNLQCDPVIRLRVYSSSPASHKLLLVVHHIAFDYWSYDVFAKELAELYASILEGRPSGLAPLKSQFLDFVQWQEDELTGPRGEQLVEYWQKQLAGELPALHIPTDRTRPSVQTYNGSSFSFNLDPVLVSYLRALAKENNSTLYVLLLAAFLVLMHRYTGQNDIVVGSPMACRDASRFERLIGYFSTAMPLRASLSGDPPFNQLVSQVRNTVLDALAHQNCPFSLLLERLTPRRDPSRSPLFDVAFSWEKACDVGLYESQNQTRGRAATQLPLELLSARQLGAPYDLSLLVFEDQAQLSGTFLYNPDLFDGETIARMAAHFQSLLRGIAEQPAARVSQIPLLSAEERCMLLEEWNQTARAYPREKALQELFEAQVERAPEAEALVCEEERVSYAELNRRANQLAWELKERGVGREMRVGVCLHRSVQMIEALLAILKAGGSYVPFDADYPRERLRFMFEDSGVEIVLAEGATRRHLPQDGKKILCLDEERESMRAKRENNPPCENDGTSVAYVMYTSGSTGVPKGVEILHRGIARLVFGQEYAHFAAGEAILQAAPVSFDASTFEIWGALLHGAKCVLFPDKVPTTEALGNAIRNHGVTTLWLTSSLFNAIVDDDPDVLAPLKQVLTGGEALSVPHIRRVRERLPNVQLINGYGPTETTTFACTFRIPAQLDAGISSISIGRPIANTRVYVLDERGEPVPVGVTGELYIGGDGVARGYWNRAELTAERFVDDRFSGEGGGKLYRTGDLVRYREDGNLEFLGRADQQVKIRGFRIELGEIETVLQKHPSIREAVVLAREESQGEKRLVAYVVPQKKGGEIPELRPWAREKLPDYMVPSAFVFLDSIPLNANGKLDKQMLPVPEPDRRELNVPFTAPETDLEKAIAKIWEAALGVEEVGRYDNFFDLGGHSLLVVQVHPKLEEAVGRKLAIVDVFRHPTISTLAKHLGQVGQKDHSFDEIHERARQQKLALAQRAGASRSRRLGDG